jgi:hypothetical protein
MPKYEFYVSVSYTQLITIEAEDQEKAHDLACETRDADIIDNGDHGFDCVFNGEISNEPI